MLNCFYFVLFVCKNIRLRYSSEEKNREQRPAVLLRATVISVSGFSNSEPLGIIAFRLRFLCHTYCESIGCLCDIP
jgi:hypothetical protein